MPGASARTAGTITLTAPTSVDLENAQAQWWRPVAQHWPDAELPPALQVLDWERATNPATPIQGSAVLVISPDGKSSAELLHLLDRFNEDNLPSIVLAADGAAPVRHASDEGPITLGFDAPPSIVAAMLSALAHRQSVVNTLKTEVKIARRFQGGLRGEIDRIHEELQLAASVQREFLPRSLPQAPNIDIQILFRPAGYVSGDIYDVIRLDEHTLGFFVADAVGHGVPAALMTMVLCRCLTTKAATPVGDRIMTPGEVMASLNRDLIQRHGASTRFATAVYGTIDTRSRRVSVAGAGHPYPLVIRGEEAEIVKTEGGLLGLFPDDQFSEASFTLEPDQALVIYSDGFETAFPDAGADQYGRRLPNRHYIDRFAALVDAWQRRGLTHALHQLDAEIDAQSGSLHQVDDLTAMVIVPSVERPLDALFSAPGQQATPQQDHSRGAPVPTAG